MTSSRARIVLLVAAAAACAGAVAAAVYVRGDKPQAASLDNRQLPDIVEGLPADAPAVLFIDMAALRSMEGSPLSALWKNGASKATTDHEYQQFVQETGFDYTRDLDRVAMAVWPGSSTTAQAKGDNPVLAIAEGRFDRDKIRARLSRTGKLDSHGNEDVYEIPGKPPVSFVFLSASRVEIASGENAETRLAGGEPRKLAGSNLLPLLDRVKDSPIFAVGLAAPFSKNSAAQAEAASPMTGLTRDIGSIAFAVHPNPDSVDLIAQAECGSANSAAQMSALLTGFRAFGAMALSNPKNSAKMTKQQAEMLSNLLAQIEIQQDTNWIRLKLHIPASLISSAMPAAH